MPMIQKFEFILKMEWLVLNYKILGLKTDIRNRLNIVKTNFYKYIGSYNGTIKVNNKIYKIIDALGCFEFNKTVW